MQYIVLDLEWNQPLSFQTRVYREVGDRLIFEMIQIGAVKVDEHFQVVDSISIPIRPQYYVKIHPRIRRMTGLGAKELEDAPVFQEAMDRFISWCGEDYVLLTWGCDDVSVLQQNLDFYDCKPSLPPLCDIQRLFSDVYECKDRKGLKVAMEMLQIDPEENRSFHNALHDAYYTALVFGRLPDPTQVLKYPQQPRALIHQERVERARLKGEVYDTVREALASPAATEPRCPVCGKKAELEEAGYVPQTADKYIALARCKSHGWLMLRASLQSSPDHRCIISVRAGKASPSNRAYVHTKQLQVEQKNAAWLQDHDSLPDPDEELLNAERTSMPFDD